jgi:regulator of sigma E protease
MEAFLLNILISIIAIMITIFFIIGFHEFGHFITARFLGVKVLRFSIGFGKAIKKWHDKKGTEYVLASIPLGGYVKMLDESEGKVQKHELHLAFNRQPLYKKFLIVAAGPVFNFMLALLLYWLLFVIGFITVVPLIGGTTPHSIASVAGIQPQEEITSIKGHPTLNWMAVTIRLLENVGENVQIPITTKVQGTSISKNYVLDLTNWKLDNLKPDPLESLGIIPYEPNIPAIIGIIEPASPASQSQLRTGDKIISINKMPVKNWLEVITTIAEHPHETFTFKIRRQDKELSFPVTIGGKSSLFSKEQGYLGLAPDFKLPPDLLRQNKYSPLPALYHASESVYDFINLNFLMLGKMLTGKVSFQSLGGPITIFEGAGSSLNAGIVAFLSFIAFISIAIGVINIIPIPGLDGGHILIYLIEFIIRRPIAQRTQELMFRLGLIALVVLAVQALANDIMRI